MKALVTGVAGFVGSHLATHLLGRTDWELVGIYSLEHKGCPQRLESLVDSERLRLVRHDLRAPLTERLSRAIGEIDVIFNVAAESHVDRSISDPRPFVLNNVELALTMLDYARTVKPRVFLQVSTDEVYGPAALTHRHVEWESHLPSNPYSASKAAQEDLAFAYWRTYGVPVVVTNTMNLYGPLQDGEKFIPYVIGNILSGRHFKIHGDGVRFASRFYTHVGNHADALQFLVDRFVDSGPPQYPTADRPARFNVVGEREIDSREMVEMIAAILGKPADWESLDFHSARPGHDRRYALNGDKLAALGWQQPISFADGLEQVVRWYAAHPQWLA